MGDIDEELADHLWLVADLILEGKVVFVLGAGANLCDREPVEQFDPKAWNGNEDELPNGAELAEWLAKELRCRVPDTTDLIRVAQYADVMRAGEGALYDKLRGVFNNDYPITSLHRFLADLPGLMADRGTSKKDPPVRGVLILSTNYDDLVERAMREATPSGRFDLVRYETNGPPETKGKFIHVTPDGDEQIIESANDYDGVDSDRQTVLLKIHGSVDRQNPANDSYVITEDHYIEYLTHANANELIPAKLLAKLTTSHLLFLGYGMRDWNLRVMLFKIFEERDRRFQSWAVQHPVHALDRKLWVGRGVDLHEHLLSVYIAGLQAALEEIARERA